MSAKHNQTGRSKSDPRHVRIYEWVSKTEAWKSLDATTRYVYIDLAFHYYGNNNGKIVYSVRQCAESVNISKDTACRALEKLQERGFIVRVFKGAFSLKERHASTWRLTEYPCDVTKAAVGSREFTQWRATEIGTERPRRQEAEKRRSSLVMIVGNAA
jgi:hypothetical protein